MLKWLFADKSEYEVSDIELRDGYSGYTVETIRIYAEKYPNEKIYFLIGSDEASYFSSWYEWKKIVELATLIIAKRSSGMELPEAVEENSILLDNEICNISSTMLRNRIKDGKSIGEYVDSRIVEYVEKRDYYK